MKPARWSLALLARSFSKKPPSGGFLICRELAKLSLFVLRFLYMWKFPIVVLALAGVGYLILNGGFPSFESTPRAPQPIVLGFIGPLSGDGATLGQHAKAAVELATEAVNVSGGIGGRPLQFVYEDGACNGAQAINVANTLIAVHKVPVILGGVCSIETAAIAPLAEQSKTVLLSYCSSAPTLSDAGDYIFRNYPSDFSQGAFAATYIFETLKKSKIAVLYVKTDWGAGIKNVFADEWKKRGGSVLVEEGFEQSSRDLRISLAKIKAKKAQLVYFVGYTDESIAALKQAAELKLAAPFFGTDVWEDPKIFAAAGKAAEGAMYPVVASSANVEFLANMKTKTGSDMASACSVAAYDAVQLLARVFRQAGLDSVAIKNELYKTVYVGGVSMPEIRFDERGDLLHPSYVVRVAKDGKAEERK